MITLFRVILIALVLVGATETSATAQTTDIPGFDRALAHIQERLAGNRYILRENVEMEQGEMKFYADLVEYFGDTNRLIATFSGTFPVLGGAPATMSVTGGAANVYLESN